MEKMFNVQMKRVRSLLDGGRSQTLNKNPRNESTKRQKVLFYVSTSLYDLMHICTLNSIVIKHKIIRSVVC